MDELVGYLADEGWSDAEIDEALSPMDRYEGRAVADDNPRGEAGQGVAEAIRQALEQIVTQTPRPGPQTVIPRGSGVPAGASAKAIRVDSADSYDAFRNTSAADLVGFMGDMPEDLDDWTSAIERVQRAELMGEPTAVLGYNVGPTGDQCCLLCGRAGAGSAVCADCRAKHAKALTAVMTGFGERGAASESSLLGFGERGSAADMYGLSAGTASLHEMLGYTARQLELMGWTGRQIELLGYTARQQELIDECDALESPSGKIESIPFYNSAIDSRHVSAFQRGQNIYSSVRITGWDRQPKILTAACGAGKPLGVIIGALEGKLPPAAVLAHAEPLARTLGAGSLLPRIAAASPGVLRAVHGLKAPIICAAIPRGRR